MHKITLLLVGILCIVLVNGRHYADRVHEDNNDDDDQIGLRRHRERSSDQTHRRRRWQSNYGYDYQPRNYYSDRRNGYGRDQDSITEIYKILDELSAYVKKQKEQPPQLPQPIPQPIYIPYPVPYPVPQYINCKKSEANMTVGNRNAFNLMSDSNQNWGFDVKDVIDYEDDGTDGQRDISFEPLQPDQGMLKPAPQVEHGSSQAGIRPTPAPSVPRRVSTRAPQPKPNSCGAAILSCCGYPDENKRRECFSGTECDAYSNEMCSTESITRTLESFRQSYAPVSKP